MRACVCWLALVAALAALARTDADAPLDVVRFRGGKLSRERCAGVLVAQAVVLTTAHCAATTPDLAAVEVAGAQVAVERTHLHPRYGVARPFANNVALLVLREDHARQTARSQDPRRNARLAALPATSSSATSNNGDDARFEEIQVRAESEARASLLDFSSRSCANSQGFRDDASVWCSAADTPANASSASHTLPAACSGAVEPALGSPVVVQTRDSSGSSGERPVVVGLRLTEPCNREQAFVYVPGVLDFVAALLASPPSTSPPAPAATASVGFGFNRTTAAPGGDSPSSSAPSESDLPATVAAGALSRPTASPATLSDSPAASSAVPAPSASPHAIRSTRPPSWTPASSSSISSSSSSSSRPSDDDVVPPVASLRGSQSSSRHADVDISTSSLDSWSSSGSRADSAPAMLGGWTELPTLGAYSSFAALLVQNSTEVLGELVGCLAILIAPRFLIADGQCAGGLTDPQVVASPLQRNSSSELLNPSRVTMLYESTATLAVIELPHAVAGMTPIALSRSLSREFDATDASWELVSMDNVFASQRRDQSVVVKQRLVRVPSTSCSVYYYEPVPLTLCFTLGAEADRADVMGFSQGMVLHNKRLVALPQCYSAICMGGLFHDATFLAAKEDWIRTETQDTAVWDSTPLDLASISRDAVVENSYIVTPPAATYAELLSRADADTALCSGVLIAPSFVLTTASCVMNATVSHVRLGLDQHVSATRAHDVLSVRRVYIHPAFGRTSARGANDLALLELSGMSFFLPALLAADDMLQTESPPSALRTSSTVSGSTDSTIESDDAVSLPRARAATPKYSWTMAVSRTDASVLCARAPPAKRSPANSITQRAVSGSGSSSSDAPSDDVVACSLIETLSQRALPGAGLLAVFPEGNTVLGIATGACAPSTCSRGADACYARVGTPSARAFIDSISVDHAWRTDWSASAMEFGITSTKKIAAQSTPVSAKKAAVSVLPADDPGYTGSLHFDSMAADAQVGFVVGLRKDKSSQNFCGGSLIAPSYVLTAAHCVVSGDARYVSVGSRESAGTQSELIAIKRSKVITHPLYAKQSSISYDVAIVELEAQAYPAPIVLDNALTFDASTVFTLFGYGANSARSAALSPVMRSVQLPFYNRESCQKYFPELDASMLCAGGQPARDACTGDSGSPLVHYVNGEPILVGVVSTGRNGCGTPGVPGIYGYVSTMQPFINSYVAGCTWRDEDKVVSPLLTTTAAATASSQSSSPATATFSPTGMRTSLTDTTNGVPFEIIHSAADNDEHQLSVVKLASDTPELLQDAIKVYLLGGYAMLGGVWQRKSEEIRDARTHVTFYSSGDMTELMTTIAAHRAKPLYQRSSRFGKRADSLELRSACCARA